MKNFVVRLSIVAAILALFTAQGFAQNKLVFLQEPTSAAAGATIAPSIVVQIQDAGGVPVAVAGTSVDIALTTGTGSLVGTLTRLTDASGNATFNDISMTVPGSKGLTATSSGVTSAVSSAFNITAATATHLVITGSAAQTAGVTQNLTITALDQFGNTDPNYTGAKNLTFSGANSSSNPVTAPTVTNNVGSAIAFGVSTAFTFTNGIATVSGGSNGVMTLYKAEGATIAVTDGGISASGADRLSVTVSAAGTNKLSFSTQPGGAASGSSLSPQPIVTIEDAFGNTTSSTATVVVAITGGTGTVGAALSGTASVPAVSGVATYTGLSIDKAGTGYTLTATSGGATNGVSSSFAITAAAASRLVITGSATQTAGATQNLTITAKDPAGNTDLTYTGSKNLIFSGANSSTNPVTAPTVTNSAGTAIAFGSTTALTFTSGVATISGGTNGVMTLYKTESATIAAADGGVVSTGSDRLSVTVSSGAVNKVAFTTEPGGAGSGSALTPQPVVTIEDAFGNTVSSTASVTVAITGGTGTAGAILSGGATVSASGGVATYSGLSIDKAGTGYTLTTTSSGLASGVSATFTITAGSLSKFAVTMTGGTTALSGAAKTAGTPFQVRVTAQDANSNTVTSYTGTVTLTSNAFSGSVDAAIAVNGFVDGITVSPTVAGTNDRTIMAVQGGTTTTNASGNFTVNPGAAASITATAGTPQSAAINAAFATIMKAVVRDANSNVVSGVSVTFAAPGSGASGAFGGTATVTTDATGTATAPSFTANATAGAYTVTATATGVVTPANFSLTNLAGAPTQLSISSGSGQSATIGSVFAGAFKALVRDAGNNPVAGDTVTFTAPGSGASGTFPGSVLIAKATTDASGIATSPAFTANTVAGSYNVVASAVGLTSINFATTNVAGAATRLVITGSASQTAGSTQSLTITAKDASGNTDLTYTGAKTLTFSGANASSNPVTSPTVSSNVGTAVSFGAATAFTFTSGVATVSGANNGVMALYKVESATIAVTDGSISAAGADRLSVTVGVGAASHLAFSQQPSGGTSNVAWGTQPTVSLEDAYGNTVTGTAATITLAIGTNPAGGTLSGTNSAALSSGTATFAGLSIDKAGVGYTLSATSSPVFTAATSSAFNITSGTAASISVSQGSSQSAAVKTAFATALKAIVRDAAANPVAGALVTFTAPATSGASGSFGSGNTATTDASGIATASTFTADSIAGSYTVNATTAGVGTPAAFSLTNTPGAASKLAFTQQPGGGTGGSAWAQQPIVTLQDASGNTVTGTQDTVTVAIQNNAGPGGILSGVTKVGINTTTGLASFAGLAIDKVGTGYTLTATGKNVSTTPGVVLSSAFNITVGAAASIAVNAGSGQSAVVHGAFGSTLSVIVKDQANNPVPGVVVTFTAPGSGASGTFAGGNTATTQATGIATSGILTANGVAGGPFTIAATVSGVGTPANFSLTNTPGAAARLVFTTQPSASTGATAFPTQPVVTVQDTSGNTVTTSGASVTLAITGGTGKTNATLIGTKILAASSGVATFSGLAIDSAGTNYTLTATSTGLTNGVSSAFTISVGAAAKLAFTVQPANASGGSSFATTPVVSVQDAGGNLVTGSTASISIAIFNNPSGGTLTGTKTDVASGGVTQFPGLSIDKAGTGYTLQATASALSSITSGSFNITVGAAAKLAFSQQPVGVTTATGGVTWTQQPVVTIQDAGGNTVNSTASVSLAITTPAGATLGGTTLLNASAGVATFTNLNIDKAGSNYTLTATSTSLTSAASAQFNVVIGPAAKLVFTAQPGNSTGGVALNPQPSVTLEDAGGNTVTTDTRTITVALTTAGGATLSGTTALSSGSNGFVTYAGLAVDKPGTYTLTASASAGSSTVSNGVSGSFTISVGVATKLAFSTQPGNGTGGSALSTQPVVTLQDAGGNTVTTSGTAVTLAIGTNAGGGTLSATSLNVLTVNGAATFANVSIDKIGTGYTLAATSGSLTAATSSAFNVTVGAGTKLVFSTQPAASTAGASIAGPPTVILQDAGGNTVTGEGHTIAMAIGTNPTSATLNGTVSLPLTSGVAPFSAINITKMGSGYTLVATTSGITGATSSAFNVSAAAATALTIENAANGTGTAIGSQNVSSGTSITVYSISRDQYGNFVGNPTPNSWTLNPVTGGVVAGDLVAGGASAVFTGHVIGTGVINAALTGVTTGMSGTLTVVTAGAPSKILVETASNGTGTVVPSQSLMSGSGLTVYAVARDASNNFIRNIPSTWSIQSITGGVVAGDLVAAGDGKSAVFTAHKVGTGSLRADSTGLTATASGTLTITPGVQSSISATAGTPQSATIITGFATQFQATVRDASTNPVSNVFVTFTAPGSDPTGTFPLGAEVDSELTNASGIATAKFFSAGLISGAYNVTATAPLVAGSALFVLTNNPGSPKSIAATGGTPQSAAVNTAYSPLQATVRDVGGNLVPNATVTFVAPASGATGTFPGPVSSTTALTNSSGIATSPTFTANSLSGTFTDTAKVTGASTPAHFTLTNTSGNATKLAIKTQPSSTATAGVAFATISSPVAVNILDASSNVITTDNSTVVTAVRVAGTDTLRGTLTATAVNGVATFTNLSYNKAETITLQFTSGSLTPTAVSNSVAVSANSAAQLAYVQQPSNVVAGIVIAPSVTVQIKDAFGNNVSSTANVSVNLGGASTGNLGGTLTRAAVAGLATFNDLTVNLVGAKTIVAASGSLSSATSTSFTVSPAAASQLVFSQSPGSATAGAAFGIQPIVVTRDPFGNNSTVGLPVSKPVTITLSSGTGPLVISGPVDLGTGSSTPGTATFSGLRIDSSGVKQLTASTTATAPILTNATSATFTVSAAAPSKLVFIVQPSTTVAGAIITPFPTVQVQDQFGNNVINAANVTVALTVTSSGTLGGTTTQTADSLGLAHFNNLTVNLSGVKQLNATAPSLTGTTSNAFTVLPGPAAKLAFTTSPSNGTAGTPFSIQPVVTVQDAAGNTVKGFPQIVRVRIQNNPGGGTMTGTDSIAVDTSSGQAAFSGLKINKIGAGYSLYAIGSSISTTQGTVLSTAFNIVSGAAAKVRVENAAGGLGALLGAQNISSGTFITMYAIARDANDNYVADTTARWSLKNIGGGVVAGDLTPNSSTPSKTAQFTGHAIGTGQVSAVVAGLDSISSGTLTVVVAGTPSKIRVETSADGSGSVVPLQSKTSGASVTGYAIARDAADNFVRNIAATWSLKSVTGGIVPADLVTGNGGKSATFTAHLIGSATMQADSTGLLATPSGVITVTQGSPYSIATTGGSGQSTVVRTNFSQSLVATVKDSSGNMISGATVTFSAPLNDPTGTFSLANSVVTTTNAVGQASSPAFTASGKAGTYVDTARVTGVATPALFTMTNTSAAAATITATAGTPQSAVIGTGGSFAIPLQATVRDQDNNPVQGVTVSFVAPASGPSGLFGTTRGATATSDVNGIATAPNFTPNIQAGSYIVSAFAPGVAVAASYALTNLAGSPSSLAIVSGTPQSVTVNTAFAQLVAIVKDQSNNPVQGALVIFTAPSSGASAGFAGHLIDSVKTDSLGIARSAVPTANITAGTYSITAGVPGLGPVLFYSMTNAPALLSTFFFEGSGGGAIGTQIARSGFSVRITAHDQYGNTVTSFTGTVGVTSTGTLTSGSGTTQAFTGGILSSLNVTFLNAGRYTLTATRTGGVEKGTSDTLQINNPSPSIVSISPAGGRKGQPPFDVTITGNGFIAGVTSVLIGDGNDVQTSSVINSLTQITTHVTISASARDTSWSVNVVNIGPGGGQATIVGGFTVGSNPAPTLDSISVHSGFRLQTVKVIVRGSKFIQGVTSVDFGAGITVNPTTVDSAGGLSATLAIGAGAAPTTRNVVVTNSAPGGGTDTLFNTFSVLNPAPKVTAVVPSTINRLETSSVVLRGSNFLNGTTTAKFGTGISVVSSTVDSATGMTFTLTVDSSAANGPRNIIVSNTAPGGGSDTLKNTLVVGNPAPKILSVTPASAAKLQTRPIVVKGKNFLAGVTTLDFGADINVQSLTIDSLTSLSATITVDSAAAAGTRNVLVVNASPGGGTDTLKAGFTVGNPIPKLLSITPAAISKLQTTSLQVRGSNFISGVTSLQFGAGIAITSSKVDSLTGMTVAVLADSNASTGFRNVVVINTAPGGGTDTLKAGFSIGSPNVAFTSIRPDSASMLQSLTVIVRGANFAKGITSFTMGAGIVVDTMIVDSTTALHAKITVAKSAVTGAIAVILNNAGSVGGAVSVNAFRVVASPYVAPPLVQPVDNAVLRPDSLLLRWTLWPGVSRYHVQMAEDSLFTTVPLKVDTTVSSDNLLVLNLKQGTIYYWHVVAIGANGDQSQYSQARIFKTTKPYASTYALNATVSYPSFASPSDYKATDYKLVGLPGMSNLPISSVVPGTHKAAWEAYWDNGSPTNYMIAADATSTFAFSAGRGFWLINKGNWQISLAAVPTIPADSLSRVTIPLHPGFNIITNPLLDQVSWSVVSDANPAISGIQTFEISEYNAGFSKATVMKPFSAYYFFYNGGANSELKIPINQPALGKIAAPPPDGSWSVDVGLTSADGHDHTTSFGVSPLAAQGVNRFDGRKPRALGAVPSAYFSHPEWDSRYPSFSSDVRPPVQDLATWPLTISTTGRTPVTVTFTNVGTVTEGLKVYLVDEDHAKAVDLRLSNVYTFTPARTQTPFRVLVGSEASVKKELDNVLPREFSLGNNFPNPFNPSTTIPVAIPRTSLISLKVYNILGAEVRTLYEGPAEAGRQWYVWDGKDAHGSTVATGVYLARLVTSTGKQLTGKMLLLK